MALPEGEKLKFSHSHNCRSRFAVSSRESPRTVERARPRRYHTHHLLAHALARIARALDLAQQVEQQAVGLLGIDTRRYAAHLNGAVAARLQMETYGGQFRCMLRQQGVVVLREYKPFGEQ